MTVIRTIGAQVEWAVASMALPGQPQCGDLHLVRDFEGGVLLAAIDGLGHGADAAQAAQVAAGALLAHPGEELSALLGRCHLAMRGTRGAALSLASISGGRLAWLGVGDVEGVLLRSASAPNAAREWIVRRGGVVGFNLPRIEPAITSIWPGDLLVLATDGIREGFSDRLETRAPPDSLADSLLLRFRKGSDDALVLVARYLGPQAAA